MDGFGVGGKGPPAWVPRGRCSRPLGAPPERQQGGGCLPGAGMRLARCMVLPPCSTRTQMKLAGEPTDVISITSGASGTSVSTAKMMRAAATPRRRSSTPLTSS